MGQVTTAVILAAGMGTRLKDQGESYPKGFIRIGSVPIIERSIKQLMASGITRIRIGTGYRSDFYEKLGATYSLIETVHNPEFATTGSLYTLFQFEGLIKEGFLLLESDLLYEQRALETLQSTVEPDLVLASGSTFSGDEVFIQRSGAGTLQNMSKDRSLLARTDCELVGISKISPDAFSRMMNWAGEEFAAGRKQRHYEDALVAIAKDYPVPIRVVDDLLWCEIDDQRQLKRATDMVYPKITRQL